MPTKGSNQQQACRKRSIEITIDDLPLACPPKEDRVWDAHPRVYLPIEEQKQVICPYCATEYILKEVTSPLL